LQVIVNELKALGEEVKDNQFSMKFLRSWKDQDAQEGGWIGLF
jgi:hypothetical protein